MKIIIYKLVKKYLGFVFDYWADEAMEEENLKHWYKARRAGWKKEDMGFYYADLEHGKRTNILGQEDNYITLF